MNKDFMWGMLYGAGALVLLLKIMEAGAEVGVHTYFKHFRK